MFVGSIPIRVSNTKKKGMKMSLIRIKLKYISNDSKSREFFKAGKKVDYIARNSGAVKFLESIDKNIENFSEELNQKQKEYSKNSNSGLFSIQDGESIEIDREQAKNAFKSIQNQIIWDGHISISKDSSNKFKYGDVQDWSSLARKFIPQLLRKEKMDIKNVNFFYSVHGDTGNPHMHFMFFEKNKEILDDHQNISFRKKGKFQIDNLKTFEDIASDWVENQNESRRNYSLKEKLWQNKLSLKQIIKNDYIYELSESVHSVIDEAIENNVNSFKKLSAKSKSKILNYFYQEINEFDIEDKNAINSFLDSFEENNILHSTKRREAFESNLKFQKFLKTEKEEFLNDVGNIILKSLKFNLLENQYLKIENTYEFNELDKKNDIATNLLNQRRKSTLSNLQTHLSSFDWANKMEALRKFKEMELGQ